MDFFIVHEVLTMTYVFFIFEIFLITCIILENVHLKTQIENYEKDSINLRLPTKVVYFSLQYNCLFKIFFFSYHGKFGVFPDEILMKYNVKMAYFHVKYIHKKKNLNYKMKQ